MTRLSGGWIDWKLSPKTMRRETASRFLLLLVLGACYSAILLSGGMNRFLSGRWTVNAILGLSVSLEEGRGIAKKAGELPGVLSAVYKDPETSWKEFLLAYPGLESLRTAGGNPLPGYVEIRMRPDRLTEKDIRAVEDALRPLPQVEKLLSGGEALARLLRAKRWVNGLFWAGFAMLCSVYLLMLFLQERGRAFLLSPDFGFLEKRGLSASRIAVSRALAAALSGVLLAAASLGAVLSAFHLVEGRLTAIGRVIGPSRELLSPTILAFLGLYLLAAALLHGAASLLGWRAANSVRG